MLNQEQLHGRLIMAANEGDARALSQALAEGANAKFKNSYALQHAAERGHAECVKRLIPVSDPLAMSSLALRWAARNGHVECLKLLIPVSDPLADSSYALQHACLGGRSECVRLLIPVSDPMADDSLALRWAAFNGHMECVALLLPVSDLLAEGGVTGLSAAASAREGGYFDVAGMIEAFIESQSLATVADGARLRRPVKKIL